MTLLWFVCLAILSRKIHAQNPLYRTTTASTPTQGPAQPFVIQNNQISSPFSSNAVIRKRLSCLENSFNFTIEFERPFSGMIYTEGSENPRCVYAEGSTNPKTQYQFLIPIDNCGSVTIRNGTLIQTSNTFLVQRDPKLIESNDNAFTVVCQRYYPTRRDLDEPSIGALTMIYERFEVIGPSEEVITRSMNEVIGREVQFGTRLALGDDPEGPLPDKPVQLGERLTYIFYCATNTSDKRDCTIGECVATDPTGTKKVQLSDHNGCSRHPTVWSNFINHDVQFRNGIQARKVFLARLSAWSFPTSSHVLISCKARSCDGPCTGGPVVCGRSAPASAPPPRIRAGFELAAVDVNETSPLDNERVANDAVERSFSSDDHVEMALDDAVVTYKVDRSTNANSPSSVGKPCSPQQRRGDAISQPEMITAEMPKLLLSESILPAPVPDSGQLTSRTVDNNSKRCVSMDMFIGLISSLMISLGIMTFVIAFLTWKLHKYNNRTPSVVRIEKRACRL